MRRADRLFQIIQILRRSSQPATAEKIARELEVSQRTIYRDIADLIGQRVPIQGEAGIGYVLDNDFSMPPLMLTPDEIEAAVLGAEWVTGRGDPVLANAARDLVAKITSIVPMHLRSVVLTPSVGTPPRSEQISDGIDLTRTRVWIREGRKIRIAYRDKDDATTKRVVWPVIIGFMEQARVLGAWCELRQDFRHFRTDRIIAAEFLDAQYGMRPSLLRSRWKRSLPNSGARA